MGNSSPSGSTTTTMVQAPPPNAAGGAFGDALNRASGWYGDSVNSVKSMSPLIGGASDYYSRTLDGNTESTKAASSLANGDWTNPATGYYRDFLTSPSAAPARLGTLADGIHNPAIDMLTPTANGAYLGGNPYNDRMFDQAAGKVRGQMADAFAGAGRYGSGAMTGSMASNLNDLATQIYGGDYAHERDLMQGAQTAIGGFSAGDTSQKMQALSEMGSLDLNGMSGLSSAAGDEARMRLAGASLLGTLQSGAAGAVPGLVNTGVNEANAALQPILFGAGNSSATSQPYFTNPVGSGLAAGAGLLGAGNMAFGKNGIWPGALSSSGDESNFNSLVSGMNANGGSLLDRTGQATPLVQDAPIATVGDGQLGTSPGLGNFSMGTGATSAVPETMTTIGSESGTSGSFLSALMGMFDNVGYG